MTETDVRPLEQGLAEMRAATERLLSGVRRLDDSGLRAPSRLPGWSRGHVLTHLARNADGMVNLVTWATTGVETPMYVSRERRNTDIEAGSGRPADEVAADLADASARLDAALVAMPADVGDAVLRLGSGAELRAARIPLHRTREIEIHHVDLDAGYTPAHWSGEFVARTLDELAPIFRDGRDTPVSRLVSSDTSQAWQVGPDGPVLHGQASALLAWLTGRSDGDGLLCEPAGPIPRAPHWA